MGRYKFRAGRRLAPNVFLQQSVCWSPKQGLMLEGHTTEKCCQPCRCFWQVGIYLGLTQHVSQVIVRCELCIFTPYFAEIAWIWRGTTSKHL